MILFESTTFNRLCKRYNSSMVKKNLSEAGKALVAARRIVGGRCPICEEPFRGTKRRKYCGPICNMRSYRARKIEREGIDERGESRRHSVSDKHLRTTGDFTGHAS